MLIVVTVIVIVLYMCSGTQVESPSSRWGQKIGKFASGKWGDHKMSAREQKHERIMAKIKKMHKPPK